jgi:light-regulated signal transduction histidine kinase (bacteriophytochrome)
MKWYDPPIQTLRGPMFRTNINEVIQFIIENIFQRVADNQPSVQFVLELDPQLPAVAINEYVIWEVFEPIIQNSIDHSGVDKKIIRITTRYEASTNKSTIRISDNGIGIREDLLLTNEAGMKRIFLEHTSSSNLKMRDHSGYGCYIAHELATQRFGWKMDVENLPEGGCQFFVTIQHEHIRI